MYTAIFKQQPITKKQLPHSNALLTETIKAWPCLLQAIKTAPIKAYAGISASMNRGHKK
jgi:hypothetical protein